MPISRPLLLTLVAAVVALVGFYATQGARDGADSADTDAPIGPVVPAEPPSPPATDESAADAGAAKQLRGTRDEPESKRQAAQHPKADTVARKPDAAPRSERVPGVPVAVQRALDRRRTVVLFFSAAGAADDRATAAAVAGLRGKPGVAVFSDPIRRLARYRGLVGALGISQAPAIVIVGRDGKARVVEGYVDGASLAQDVADTR